jgi:hypothetical protein
MGTLRSCTALAALLIGLSWGTTGNCTLIDFNTTGDLANNFNSTATLPYSEADGVGLGNPASRGLTVTGTTDSGSVYKNGSMSFANVGDQIIVSAFFHTGATLGTTGEARVFELNAVALNTNIPTAAHTGIGAKIEFGSGVDDVLIRFRQNNADVASSLSPTSFDIQANTWYKATFTATNQGTASTIPASMVLDSYGADGTSLVAANVFSHSFSLPASAALAADPDVFGAFRVRNGTRLYNAVDNFEQVSIPVPEPATWILGSLAGLAVVLRRRTS